MKYLLLFPILFCIGFCGVNTQFDKLYQQQQFEAAFQALQRFENKNSLLFQESELKVLLHLAMSDKLEYFSLLQAILEKKTLPETLQPLSNLAKSWIMFVKASDSGEYQKIISILPKERFKDPMIEKTRLIIYTHTLLQLNQFSEILSLLTTDPLTQNSSDLLYIHGMAYWNLKNYALAKHTLQKLIKLSSTPQLQSLAYLYIADICEKEKKWDQAIQHYLMAWDLNPYHADLNLRIGRMLQSLSYEDLHHRFYRAALRLNENLAEAWYYLNSQ